MNGGNYLRLQDAVQQFQTRTDIPVMLLTSQVGGLGLTLTAADRVIILDPAWNPATDAQSVDRAYRIGQSKDVVVRPVQALLPRTAVHCFNIAHKLRTIFFWRCDWSLIAFENESLLEKRVGGIARIAQLAFSHARKGKAGMLTEFWAVAQVYRLISCGTVEEKIYRKQVFKGGLFRRGMEDGAPFQYFSQQVHSQPENHMKPGTDHLTDPRRTAWKLALSHPPFLHLAPVHASLIHIHLCDVPSKLARIDKFADPA